MFSLCLEIPPPSCKIIHDPNQASSMSYIEVIVFRFEIWHNYRAERFNFLYVLLEYIFDTGEFSFLASSADFNTCDV